MTDILSSIVDRAEKILDGFGLMTGPYAPLKRAAVGATLGAVLVTSLQWPPYFFNGGKARPWCVTDSGDPNCVYFPWWTVPLASGAFFGLAI